MELSRRPARPVRVSVRRPRSTAPAHLARDFKEVVVVDPDRQLQRAAQEALRAMAVVEAYSDFRDARGRVLAKPPDLLVTNVRLETHNGLHLVHLAPAGTRCVVYGTDEDLALAREAQAAGAFFVRAPRLARALQSFLRAQLPTRDRRDATVVDRRKSFRGGRRCTDR